MPFIYRGNLSRCNEVQQHHKTTVGAFFVGARLARDEDTAVS
ncbi:hypothetical protein AK973_0569 [Pseudomonas brassicacearum]|nr:hypothetical protein AK973_0569 [Pseudomonas brassicacearum]